jgi:hypothetical protein
MEKICYRRPKEVAVHVAHACHNSTWGIRAEARIDVWREEEGCVGGGGGGIVVDLTSNNSNKRLKKKLYNEITDFKPQIVTILKISQS